MQNAEVVLGVLRERGRKGLPCHGFPIPERSWSSGS